jgi:hypothetical protein
MSLLDLILKAQEIPEQSLSEGALDVHTRLCHALTNAIRQSGLSRWEIAGRMSHLLGQEVTQYMLNGWTAESKEAHRFPAEFLPAFCSATGSRAPLEMLSTEAGMFCLPGPEALRAEIQKLREEEQRASRERRKRELFLKEMEG